MTLVETVNPLSTVMQTADVYPARSNNNAYLANIVPANIPESFEALIPDLEDTFGVCSQNEDLLFPQRTSPKRPHEQRDLLTPETIAHLVRYYEIKRIPSKNDLLEISLKFCISVDRIRAWFETQHTNDTRSLNRLDISNTYRYS